jgi:hypothetical protein
VLVLGILGFVEKSTAPLVRELVVETPGGLFSFFPTILGLIGHPLQMGALKFSHHLTGL